MNPRRMTPSELDANAKRLAVLEASSKARLERLAQVEAARKDDRPMIYCFIHAHTGTDVVSMALAEDGTVLGGHVSSDEWWARSDCGYLNTGMGSIKRKKFAAHYPEGYSLEWVYDPPAHEGLTAAIDRNDELREQAETKDQDA